MARKKSDRPTDAELAILNILWDKGPCTVQQVHDIFNKRGNTGYTTALKFLQIMDGKGLVSCDKRKKAHVYKAKLRKEPTQKKLVKDLVSRAFGGAAHTLAMQALSTGRASKKELTEIRQLLDKLEGRRK